MSNTNLAIETKYEHGGGYGVNEGELLYALRKKSKLTMLKMVVHDVSLWSVLVGLFFWGPLLWSLMLYPAFVILALVLRNFIDMPNSDINMYAASLAYAAGIWLSLRKQTPVRDYMTRKQHAATKTLHLDCTQKLLVAEEAYRFFPAKNRTVKVPFEHLHTWATWQHADKERADDDSYLDSVSIYLRIRRNSRLDMEWANKKIGDPVFYHQYDSSDATQNAQAKAKFDEVMALFADCGIGQK
ncbi:hypothetical protein UNDYM_4168 [Undibacterium sp. YM2]|uniref:hypothetical protein n=1 Tax=Undibacterium sp. YM2 TaxID=2058625 RepID=UPI001331DD1B|nr:hypothetical protein [Undibacterium sp. YM2]BBB68421.1 hypothetical protein UNDYM_4168 [Undibacterium sp. YM2]